MKKAGPLSCFPAGCYTPAVVQLFADLANLTLCPAEGYLSFFVLVLYDRSHHLQFLHANTLILHFCRAGVSIQSSQTKHLLVHIRANLYLISVGLWVSSTWINT